MLELLKISGVCPMCKHELVEAARDVAGGTVTLACGTCDSGVRLLVSARLNGAVCRYCTGWVIDKRPDAKYCSDACREKAYRKRREFRAKGLGELEI
jgi:hypothetical protein